MRQSDLLEPQQRFLDISEGKGSSACLHLNVGDAILTMKFDVFVGFDD
jgi:hypothetical protein